MSRYRFVIMVAALTAVLWPSSGMAQGMENTRSVSVSVGTGFGLGGNIITEAVGAINLGGINDTGSRVSLPISAFLTWRL